MTSASGTAVRVLLLIATFVVVVAVSIGRGLSFGEDVGVQWPSPGQAIGWVIAWVAWVAVSEVMSVRLGLPRAEKWTPEPAAILIARVVAIVVFAPVAEELVFRGVLFHRLDSALGVVPAVLLSAALFAVLHLQYRRPQMVLILLDGVVLGTARATSGSVLLTGVLHAIGNGFAVYQRLRR